MTESRDLARDVDTCDPLLTWSKSTRLETTDPDGAHLELTERGGFHTLRVTLPGGQSASIDFTPESLAALCRAGLEQAGATG